MSVGDSMTFIIALGVFLIVFGVAILMWSSKVIKYEVITIENKKICEDLDIVFVSDFHVGRYMKKRELNKIISLINKVDGDCLLIGGDMIGKRVYKLYKDEQLRGIIDQLKIKDRYFVGGNHDDYSLSLYKNFKILNDESVNLSDNVALTGLRWEKGECLDNKLNNKKYNILLSHYPDRVIEYSKIDLALGAHSHGLQVNLPFCRFHHKEKYTRGLYEMGNNKFLYVNRGLGFSFLKIRFLSTREIVKIELRKCE